MRDVLVLCYHGVSARWPASISIAPDVFERQVGGLLKRGYRPAGFTEAVLAPPHRRTLAVTFDDAFASVLEIAHPILARLGAIATVYAPTAHVGRGEPMRWEGIEEWHGGPHEDELRDMGWDGLRTLRDEGWEIGSHTRTHPHLTRLADEQLREELEQSRLECEEQMARPCRSIAYPYGDVDPRVIAATAAAGYAAAGAVSSTRPPRSLDWPRVGVWQRDAGPRFALKASPLLRAARLRVVPARFG